MIGFAGLSHLGINYSLATAAKGFDVIAFEPDAAMCERLKKGDFPIEEPGLKELYKEHGSRIRYTTSVEELGKCDLVFFALDIKTDSENRSDVAPLRALIDRVFPHLASGSTMVVLSQVTPGFSRKLLADLRANKEFKAAHYYYQVETLIFGRAVERAMYPERYIVGSDDPSRAVPEVFAKWHEAFNCPVLVMRYESAELAKIAINFYLVSSVSTTNTLAEVCENIGAEWAEIVPALRLDARIGQKAYLAPGLGFAGGNLERDLVTVKGISDRCHTDVGVVDAWIYNSHYRRDWAVRVIRRELLDAKPKAQIAVWGLAYKQDTHSVKNSPSIAFLEQVADVPVRAYDPVVKLAAGQLPHVTQVASEVEACKGAEALLILTAWGQFKKVSLDEIGKALAGKLILDPYGVLEKEACERAGFRYLRLGSPLV